MITLTNLEKIYRTKEIETVPLENVNLTVDRGEFLSIMGPSGCGKSTLLNIIGAHVNAFAGISFADRNVYFAEKSIAERSALPIPHSPVCVSNLLHMFAMSASCGEAVSVIAPTMLPHRHMLLL